MQNLTLTPPRSGRELLGGYAWLARLADKVRAEQAGTNGEYVAYCGLSKGFLERVHISVDDFDQLIRGGVDDTDLVRYFNEHVGDAERTAANAYVLNDMVAELDYEDAEERR
jgi:hypothetical protein